MQKAGIELTRLFENVAHELGRRGYSKSTIGVYRATWNKLFVYSPDGYYDRTVCRKFLLDRCFVDPGSLTQCLDRQMRGSLRHINVLHEYVEHGTISRRYTRARSIQDSSLYDTFFSEYMAYFHAPNHTSSWGKSTFVALRLFSEILKPLGITSPGEICSDAVLHYIELTSDTSPAFKRMRYLQVKEYLKWLKKQGFIKSDYSELFPAVHRKPVALPQVWSENDISRMLAAIDSENPVGKRNYAIFLLLSRTGLRISDVVSLEFSNICWRRNVLSIIQCKTNQPLTLPISKEIGLAIIDYVKNGRPKSDSQKLFLSHLAPFQPLAYHNNFSIEFRKYMRRAGIVFKADTHNGVHTLRHSFATNMLNEGVSLKAISDIVGHSSIHVTSTYLRVETKQLKLCALSVEV